MINSNFDEIYKNLDNFDFLPFFKSNTNFEEVIDMLENSYGEIFDVIARSEFVDYINKRYSPIIKIFEVFTYIFEIKEE